MPPSSSTSDPCWQLAQINVARARAPLTDPLMARFVAQLDEINQLAESAPGFVWRLQDEAGGPSSYVRFDDDERLIVNMSVWTDVEALHHYVYRSAHAAVYRDRGEWFEPLDVPFALWWIRAGHTPSVEEGRRRLDILRQHGPTTEAFTFKKRFEAVQAKGV